MAIYLDSLYEYEPKLSDAQIKAEIRNLKIKIISGEFKVNFSDVNAKKHSEELNFILNKLSKDDIITGSLALKLYGLLDRQTGDIDIFINDKYRYQGYRSSGYGEVSIDNRLGYKTFVDKGWWPFSKKEYEVDFFLNDGSVKYNEMDFNGKKLKIHNPIDIINQKMNIYLKDPSTYSTSIKHYKDLITIFNKVDLEM